MAQTLRITLTRPNTSVSWGFRLQGGTDFTTPLSIQMVQPGSVAEQCGLKAGDGVLQINGSNADLLEHDQAKQEIVRSGNEVNFLIQRGAVTIWKPQVTPMSELRPEELQTHALPGEAPPIQKTSLASKYAGQEASTIGVAHNRAARPFPGAGSSGYDKSPSVVHNQVNTPMNMYSADNIADTYVQQADALQHEVASLNISNGKENGDNKKKLTPTQLLLLEEENKNASGNSSDEESTAKKQSRSFKLLQQELETGNVGDRPPGIRSVQAPKARIPGDQSQKQDATQTCAACGMLVTGVFVRVKGQAMHADCFRCAKCRKSLKNQGYFWIDEKMYCEQHAKELTRPGPGMDATAVYN